MEKGTLLGWYKGIYNSTNNNPYRIFKSVEPNRDVEIFFNENSELCFLLKTNENNISGVKLINQIPFNAERSYMISLTWSDFGAEQKIFINGIPQKVAMITNPSFPIFESPSTTSNRKKLFLSCISDLESKISSNDEYNLIKASELIRQLSFDRYGNLIEKIAKTTSFEDPILFNHGVLNNNPELFGIVPNVTYLGDAINPDEIFSGGIKVVSNKIKGFLDSPIMYIENTDISVKNILEFVLYKLGGTHQREVGIGQTDINQKANIIEKLQETTIYNFSVIIRLVKPIGNVILKGLTPLIEHVEKNN